MTESTADGADDPRGADEGARRGGVRPALLRPRAVRAALLMVAGGVALSVLLLRPTPVAEAEEGRPGGRAATTDPVGASSTGTSATDVAPEVAPEVASEPVRGPSAAPSVCVHTPTSGGGWSGIAPQRWHPLPVWRRADGVRAVDPDDVPPGPDAPVRLAVVRATAARVVAALDEAAPFAWRSVLSEVAVGCAGVAGLDCPGGLARGDRIIISPAALHWSDAELAYVLRHELAHVWQFATGDMPARYRDLDGLDLGAAGLDPHEVAADCLAAHWGSPSAGAGYLECPPEGVRRMGAVFAGLRDLPVRADGST